jgi:hypothetical protein
LKRIGYHSVCLGSYIPWDVKDNLKYTQQFLPWWQGDDVEGMPKGLYSYEKIECFMQGVRDYIKYVKRGYGRVTQMTTLDIRNKRMSRDEAVVLIRKYEGRKPRMLSVFLDYLGMTEDEFNEIVMKTAIPPYAHDFSQAELADPIADIDFCYREKKGVVQ